LQKKYDEKRERNPEEKRTLKKSEKKKKRALLTRANQTPHHRPVLLAEEMSWVKQKENW
jgi:hypothetical protein